MGDQQIADVFAHHYARVGDAAVFAEGAGFDAAHMAAVEAEVADLRNNTSRAHAHRGPASLNAPFTPDEVAEACAKLHNNKAANPLDNIQNELLKHGGEEGCLALTAFFNLQWEGEAKAQSPGVIRSLYKKGDPAEPTNYRPITLGCTIDKLYNLLINRRLVSFLEEDTGKLHDAQNGFRPGRNTADNIFMLSTVLNARLREKKATYLLFLDVEKAWLHSCTQTTSWRPPTQQTACSTPSMWSARS